MESGDCFGVDWEILIVWRDGDNAIVVLSLSRNLVEWF
jgi:hypothetical protein